MSFARFAMPGRTAGGAHVDGFKSTDRYIASRDLEVAVNAAVACSAPC